MEGSFHTGVLSPTFKKKREGQSALLAPGVLQVPVLALVFSCILRTESKRDLDIEFHKMGSISLFACSARKLQFLTQGD